ncbi:protein phosphatase 2C domain-containing protein [Toxoplasma gondii CAST]|uniref:Protein phosphatase 2C domain-containing protein n=1 Tax=Toxoplasma gondii CAST TaxID=943122 RepID=A0A3R8A3K7_TOXGO|nr:protein phosphatase 2C domain-containing protein [Toxoplasma gondii CAST]
MPRFSDLPSSSLMDQFPLPVSPRALRFATPFLSGLLLVPLVSLSSMPRRFSQVLPPLIFSSLPRSQISSLLLPLLPFLRLHLSWLFVVLLTRLLGERLVDGLRCLMFRKRLRASGAILLCR